MGYLLDTNIVSDFVRYQQRAVARRIRERGEADVLTSIIVAAELRLGAAKRGAVRKDLLNQHHSFEQIGACSDRQLPGTKP